MPALQCAIPSLTPSWPYDSMCTCIAAMEAISLRAESSFRAIH